MNRVKQKSLVKADCGIACLAMVAKCSYEKAFSRLGHLEKDGKYYSRHGHIISALKLMGISASQKRFRKFRDIKGIAIVAVNRRENGTYWHWIVYNENNSIPYIYDPNPNKKNKISDFRGLKGAGNYISII